MKSNSSKKKKFKYFNLIGVKKENFLKRYNLLLNKYLCFRKKNFLYKRGRFTHQKKNHLTVELSEIQYGFGDSGITLRKTIFAVENCIIKFMVDTISSICHISSWRTSKRPTVQDVLFLFRNSNKKLERIKYLIKMKNLFQKIMGSDKNKIFLFEKKIS